MLAVIHVLTSEQEFPVSASVFLWGFVLCPIFSILLPVALIKGSYSTMTLSNFANYE